MTAYKITLEASVTTDGTIPADDLGVALCDVIDSIVSRYPTVSEYGGIRYELTEDGKEATFTSNVSEHGNSLAINITKHADEIGVGKGDKVVVTVRRYA